MAEVLGGIVKGIAKILGASLLHMRVTVFELPRLVISRKTYPGIGQQFVGGIEAGKVAVLGEDHSAHAETHPRNGCDRRLQFLYNVLDSSLDFLDFSV